MNRNRHLYLIIALAVAAVVMRVVPHHANMAAMGALSLVAGMYAPGLMAVAIPLTAIVISDSIIGFYNPSIMAAVYASYVVMIGVGALVRYMTRRRGVVTRSSVGILGAAAGSVAFFLITNAAVWMWGTMYPHTLQGLWMSYVNGLPFFRNSLTSDMAYGALFIIGIEVVAHSRIFQTKTKHATLGSA